MQQASGRDDAHADRCGVRTVRAGNTSEYKPDAIIIKSETAFWFIVIPFGTTLNFQMI